MSSTLPPNILNLKHCEISTGSCWQSGPGPGACHQLPPWAHTHTHTHTHVKCTCIFAKLWLSTFRNFCNSIMVSQRLWRKNTDLDDYLNTEVNKAAILHIFNYYNFLECWLFAWPRYPHQPRFCDSRAQTGFACQLQIALGDRYRKFYRTLNNAKKPFNSTFNSIFPKFIHSNKLFIYIF